MKNEKEINSAINSEFSEFIGVAMASMMNKDLGIFLKEGKGEKPNLELDISDRKKYAIPTNLWNLCLEDLDWLPPLKGKPQKKFEE